MQMLVSKLASQITVDNEKLVQAQNFCRWPVENNKFKTILKANYATLIVHATIWRLNLVIY
jgi:hypothetical protein